MTCCTADPGGRRRFLAAALGAVAAACAGPTTAGSAKREREITRQGIAALGPIVDPHAHPGRFTLAVTGELSLAAIEEMRSANVHCAFFAAVGDGLVIRREGGTGPIRNYRDPVADELYRSTIGQLERVRRRGQEGHVRLVRGRADLVRLTDIPTPSALLAIEGGDPLEGKVERVREFYELGVRSIQLVHYRVNELGDIQTEDSVHNGLTPFGADAVRTCNRLGIIVDVAHATWEATRQAAKISTRPLLLSHTFLRDAPRRYTRGITREHALTVKETGGVIGVVPFPSVFFTLQDYTEGIARMADAVGVNHVGIGGDLAGVRGGPPYHRFEQFPALVQMLQNRGFGSDDVARIAGGNFMRLFLAVSDLA